MNLIEKECTLAWFYGQSEVKQELQLSLKHYRTGLELIYFERDIETKLEYLAILSEVSFSGKRLKIKDVEILFSDFLSSIHSDSEDDLNKAMFSYNILKKSLDISTNHQEKRLYLSLANILRFPDLEVSS